MNQVVEMSIEERKAMYRMIDKERLIEMLISANDNLTRLTTPLQVYNVDVTHKIKPIRPSLPDREMPSISSNERSKF